MNRIPAMALTSSRLHELMRKYTHTPKDSPEIIDPAKLVHAAFALRDLLRHLNR